MIVREDKAKNMKSEIITSQSNNVDTGVCATILGPGSEVGFIISAIKWTENLLKQTSEWKGQTLLTAFTYQWDDYVSVYAFYLLATLQQYNGQYSIPRQKISANLQILNLPFV